jgi:hypothetical protein
MWARYSQVVVVGCLLFGAGTGLTFHLNLTLALNNLINQQLSTLHHLYWVQLKSLSKGKHLKTPNFSAHTLQY